MYVDLGAEKIELRNVTPKRNRGNGEASPIGKGGHLGC